MAALLAKLARFSRHADGASAVEFSIVAAPFIYMILGILQIGIYYMAQSSLDAGVLKTAAAMRSSFTSTTPSFPAGSALKSQVVSNAGGLVYNDGTLAVEIRQLTTLDAGVVAVADGTADYGSTTSTLVIRAQSNVVVFAPGFGPFAKVRSSAIVRRQGT